MANPIDSERKRKALKPQSQPYRYKIKPLHYLAYRRNKNFDGGKWIAILVRAHHQIGIESNFDYSDALDAALKWFASCEGESGNIVVNATVQTAVDDYVASLRVEKTDQTARETGARIRKHASAAMLKTKLSALTTRQIKLFRDGMVKLSDDPEVKRKSQDTANRVMGMLKAALNLAYRDGLVSSDKVWRRVERFKSVVKARTLFLSDKQVRELLDATTGDFHDLVELAVHTGARYGELTTATVSDFDPVDGTLHLSGKTGARTTYLSDTAVAVVQRIVRNKLPGAYLLMQDDGGQWIKGYQRAPLKQAVRRAKLPAETVFYSLRHYHISKALLAGVNAQVVAENTGTSIPMIEKHYGKFMKADRRAMFNRVELG